MSSPNPADPFPWKYRRSLVFWTIAACSLGVGYLTLAGTDTRLNETLAYGYFALWTATLGSYVFGAVWHDRGVMENPQRTRRRRPLIEASETEDTTENERLPNVEDR